MSGPDLPSDRLDAVRLVLPLLAVAVLGLAVGTDPGTWWQGSMLAGAALLFVVRVQVDVPTPVLAVAVLVLTAGSQLGGALEPGFFLLSLLALALTDDDDPGWLVWTLVGLVLLTPPLLAWLIPDAGFAPWIWMLGIAFPAALGWAVGRQERLVRELTAARHALADQAVLEERRRIARDVHDLVGHGLAAALVQVTSARHVLRRDPDAADEALEIAERVGRSSMHELRATLALLRDGSEQGATSLPGVADLPTLVETACAGGMRVSLRTVGDPGRLDPVVGLTFYRIAQEALANATRHAPGSPTTVLLDATGQDAVLEVTSAGATVSDGDPQRPRYGVRGMRERAEVVGGSLEAGPTDAGWLVRCVVPTGVAP